MQAHIKLPSADDVLATTFEKKQPKFCLASPELFFLKTMRADVRSSSYLNERNETRQKMHFYQSRYGSEETAQCFGSVARTLTSASAKRMVQKKRDINATTVPLSKVSTIDFKSI